MKRLLRTFAVMFVFHDIRPGGLAILLLVVLVVRIPPP